MNNYIIDEWQPVERGTYKLRHWEVGYYCDFDTDNPLESWVNPYTNEEIEVFHFVLGPIERFYVATQAISQIPNMFQPEDWPKRSLNTRGLGLANIVATLSNEEMCARMAAALHRRRNGVSE